MAVCLKNENFNLTPRELEVLNYSKIGLSNSETANIIHVSKHTTKAHMSDIIRKLKAKNRTHAVYIAFKNGLID